VSRQREYLADASAVQFTRNPGGIAGALKRIGGLAQGSIVENPGAPEISHAFFAQGVSGFMQAMSATHPPLEKRIRRIDPQWDGKFDLADLNDASVDKSGEETAAAKQQSREELAQKVAMTVSGAAMADIKNSIDQIGKPKAATIDHARALIDDLPGALKDAARESFGARAVIYALLLDAGQTVRDMQLAHLQQHADAHVFALTNKIMPQMRELDIKFRLPLINIAIPSLKQLSLEQYQTFKANLDALIEMDAKVDMFEWSLQKILFNHLDGQFFKLPHIQPRFDQLSQLKPETEMVLSMMAHAGHDDLQNTQAAFSAAVQTLDFSGLQLLDKNELSIAKLDLALQRLEMLKPLAKPQLLKACATSVMHDQQIAPVEVELMRAFSDVLGCPMPPITQLPVLV
jgi:hypothetical protein